MIEVDGVRIERRLIGTKVVFTAPEIRGLHVSMDPSEEHRAESSIRSCLAMLARMRARTEARGADPR